VLEERDDARVVEVAVADVVADLDAAVPGLDGPVELAAGGVGVLQRHLAERDEPLRCLGRDLQREVVEDRRGGGGGVRGLVVGEEDGGGGEHLPVDAVAVHRREPHVGVPRVVGDAAERPVAQHDRRLGRPVDPQRRLVARAGQRGPPVGHVVGVDVGDGVHTPIIGRPAPIRHRRTALLGYCGRSLALRLRR
jgi:hypothetical protein